MTPQTTGFRAGCREQAGLAMGFLARLFQGTKHPVLACGCLLFAPFLTLTVWMVQLMIQLTIAAPVLTFALLMATMGGGFSRGSTPALLPPPYQPYYSQYPLPPYQPPYRAGK